MTVTVVKRPTDADQLQAAAELVARVNAARPGSVALNAVGPEEMPHHFGHIAPPAVIVDDLVVSAGAALPAPRLRQIILRALRQAGLDVGEIPDDEPGEEFRIVTEGAAVHLEAEEYMASEGCEPMLLFWHVEVGQPVTKGQELAEIETAKVVFVLESPAEGVVEAIHVAPGDAVTPGLRLVTIRVNAP